MTRRSCLISLVVWLLAMILPILALLLAVRGELAWRRGPFVEDRVWLVNLSGDAGEERASGLAYSRTRLARPPALGASQADPPICARTSVYFLLWRGRSETLDYCECYQPAPLGGYELIGTCS